MTEDEIIDLIHNSIYIYKEKIKDIKKQILKEDMVESVILARRLSALTFRIYALRDLLEDITGEYIDDEDL